MDYKKRALEFLGKDIPFSHKGIGYAILSLGQSDEVSAIANAAILFVNAEDSDSKIAALEALTERVYELTHRDGP